MTMKFPALLDISHIEMGMFNNLGVGLKKNLHQDFLGSPVVKIPHFQCRDVGFIIGQGTKIPCDTWHSQKKLKVKNKKEPIPKAHSKTLKNQNSRNQITSIGTLKTSSKWFQCETMIEN